MQNSSDSSVLASTTVVLRTSSFLVSAPIRLPLIPSLLTQSKGRFVHQSLPLLDLHAWELSNNQSEIKNFRKTLQIMSLDQEEHLHKKSTVQNGPSSQIGVASVAQLDAPSDWRPGGRGFNPRRGWQHSFVEINHEIFSTVILSLPLIQEG